MIVGKNVYLCAKKKNMFNIELAYGNNQSISDGKNGFKYVKSLAKSLMWLFSDEADGPNEEYYNLEGTIKLYQLVSAAIFLVSYTRSELGETSIKEYVQDMKKDRGYVWNDNYNMIRELPVNDEKRGLSIMYASDELVMSILWSAYIYCIAMSRFNPEKWTPRKDLFYRIMKSESHLSDNAFANHWLIKNTDARVNAMLNDIEEVKKKNDTGSKVASKETTSQLIKDMKDTMIRMDARIMELEKENKKLSQQQDFSREMTIELLSHIFYNDEKEASDFYNFVQGKDDLDIAQKALELKNQKKISSKSCGRDLWRILHAAKLYRATESNWNTYLRKH